MSNADTDADSPPVLIVGAGPVGLAMAVALRRLGVACRIVDADDGPTPEGESRALGVQARTMEVFEALGLAGPIREGGLPVRGAAAFEGRRERFRLGFDVGGLETAYPFILTIPQGATERHLIARLEALGGRVEWRSRVAGLRRDDSGVTATIVGGDGRSTEVRADWLVGCDGAHSVARHALGLSFEGAAYPEHFLLADVRLDWEPPAGPDHAVLMLGRGGLLPALPLPDRGLWRLIDPSGRLQTDDPGAIAERFRQLLTERSPVPVRITETTWTSGFRIHRRSVERLRVGRCLLAGDSAHIHSPVGGQGMNTGIQDVFNLAWKLAMVLRGAASPDLLDTYDAERRPIAESVLSATDRATRMVTLQNPLLVASRDAMIGLALGRPGVRRQIVRAVADLEVNYRRGPLALDDWPTGSDGPRAGERLPDLPVDLPGRVARLHDLTRSPWFTLLVFMGLRGPTPDSTHAVRQVLELVADRHADLVRPVVVAGPGPLPDGLDRGVSAVIPDGDGSVRRRFGSESASLYLVRPDGYVAYRSMPPSAGRLADVFSAFR